MDLDGLLSQLRRAARQHDLYPPATTADRAVTESALGRRLPQSFWKFVSEFSNGAYLYGVQEVSSVGDSRARAAHFRLNQFGETTQPVPIHENEWHYGAAAMAEASEMIPIREGGAVPYRALVPFSLDSNGNEWCFIMSDDGDDPPVAYFSSPLARDPHDRRLYSPLGGGFTQWLSILVKDHRDEVIRRVYRDDEDVLYNELMLG